MLLRHPVFSSALVFGAVLIAACSGGSTATTSSDASFIPEPSTDGGPVVCVVNDGTMFISQIPDFTGFCNWPSAPAMPEGGDASDGIHGLGPLRVYWNKPPPHGCSQFPVGTIILKESEETDPTKRTVFAMVKRQARGGVFNSTGAQGWEWWSLEDNGDCTVTELWRGPSDLSMDSYAGTPAGDCNGCHGMAMNNDYVWDEALQLSSF
jgi:hypothetical protein